MMRHWKAVLSHGTLGRRKEWVKQTFKLACNSFPKISFNFEKYSVLQGEFMLTQQAGSLLKKSCRVEVQLNLQTPTCEMWLTKLYLWFSAGVLQQLNSKQEPSWLGKALLEYFFMLLCSFLIFTVGLPSNSIPHFLANGYSSNPGLILLKHGPAWQSSCLGKWKQGWASGTQHSLRPLFSKLYHAKDSKIPVVRMHLLHGPRVY